MMTRDLNALLRPYNATIGILVLDDEHEFFRVVLLQKLSFTPA